MNFFTWSELCFGSIKMDRLLNERIYVNNFSCRVMFVHNIYDREAACREYINEFHHLARKVLRVFI
jgi:hypothetical protein